MRSRSRSRVSTPGEGASGWKKPQSISPACSAASWRDVGRLVELQADAREAAVEPAQDVGQDGRHGEPGERDPQAPDPARGHGPHVRGHPHEGRQHRLDALDEARRPPGVSSTRRLDRVSRRTPRSASS